MEKIRKKIISIVLAAAMVFTILSGLQPVQASTGGRTADDAIAWARSQVGKALDYDGYYGAQCADFIAYYCQYLGASPIWGNAIDYTKNAIPAGWQRIQGAIPQKGDILVYTNSPYGHVAIFESANVTYHQNYNGRQYVQKVTNVAYNRISSYWGVIRPDFANVPVVPQVEHGAPMETGGTQTIADGDYHIAAAGNRWQCLTIGAASTQNGANAQMWGCKEEDDQVFTVKYLGNGFYSIIYKKSGKYLDVSGNSTAIQTNVHQWEYTGAYAQQWVIRESGDGASYTIQARCSGYNLDMADGKTDNGTNVQVYKAHGGMAQRWLFIPWSKSVGRTLDDGEYQIYSKCSGLKGLSAEGNGQTAGNNVVLGTINGDKGQVFCVRYLPDGSYSISNKYSGLMLDVDGASLKRGATVHLWTPNGGDVQKWILKPSGGGYYNVVSRLSGKYLDLTDLNTADGTNIQVWDGNSTKAQEWKFVKWIEPARKPDTKPVDSNNGQTPGTSGGNDNQTPGTSGGNEGQTPGTSGGNDNQTPGTSGGNEGQTPGTSGGNDNQTPGTSEGNEGQKPGTSEGNEGQKPETGGGNENQKPDTTGGNSQPGADSGNETGGGDIIIDNPDDPTLFDPDDLFDGFDSDDLIDPDDPEDFSEDVFYDVEWNVSSAVLQLGKSTSKVKAEASEDDDIDKYLSSDTSVVTVNDDGIITAKGVGKAVVRAVTEHGCTADVVIKVQKKAVVTKKIIVKSKNVQLKAGKTYQLGAQVTPITSSQRIVYKSSNSKIVAVNSKGKIKAKKAGTVTIKVRSGKKVVKISVNVK